MNDGKDKKELTHRVWSGCPVIEVALPGVGLDRVFASELDRGWLRSLDQGNLVVYGVGMVASTGLDFWT